MANWLSNFFGIVPHETMSSDSQLEEKSFDRLAVLTEIAEANGSTAGASVTQENAIKQSAVLACARVIAEGLAQVPCSVLRQLPDGSREEATDHQLYNLLCHSPNDWQTSFEFREQIGLHLALRNNAYIYVNRNARGRPRELYAFEPSRVTVTRHTDYTLTYQISVGTNETMNVPAGDMWHIRGPSWNGWQGMDAIQYAADAIGLGQATEKFGADLFKNGARPGGTLTTEQPLTQEQVDKLRTSWSTQQAGGTNAHKTAVLSNGLKFQAITSSANEAQWTEARRYQIVEICRFFRVNPVMIMQQDNATSYNSIEQLFLAHLTHTLMPWFTRFEQSAYMHLLTPADKKAGYYIKLNEKAILRASTADRIAYYREARTQGWMTANEVREKEDLPRKNDAWADQLTPAANLFGNQTPATDDEADQDDN